MNLNCKECGSIKPTLYPSGKHLRADCSICGKYIKFVPQNFEWIAQWEEEKSTNCRKEIA